MVKVMTMLARVSLIFILGCVICNSANENKIGTRNDILNREEFTTPLEENSVNGTRQKPDLTTTVRIAHFLSYWIFLINLRQ